MDDSFFLSSFPLRYSIIVNVFDETGYAWTLEPSIPSLSFSLSFSQKKSPPSHISLFLTKINPPLSNQIFDKIWYIWWPPSFSDSHSQNQMNPQLHHLNPSLLPSLFFPYLYLVFRPFPSFYTFIFSFILSISSIAKRLKKTQKRFSLKKFFCK